MARPTKPAIALRKRWDALYVSEAERREITLAAKAVGLSVSKYLIAAHSKTVLRPALGDATLMQAMLIAQDQLEQIAKALSCAQVPIDAVILHADLLAIERGFRHAMLPWASSLATEEASPK